MKINLNCKSLLSRFKLRKELKGLTIDQLEEVININKEEEFLKYGFLINEESFINSVSELDIDPYEKFKLKYIILKNNKDIRKQYKNINKCNKIILNDIKRRYKETKDENLKALEKQVNTKMSDDLFKTENSKSEDYIEKSSVAVASILNQAIREYNMGGNEALSNARNEIYKLFKNVLRNREDRNYFYAMLVLTIKLYIQENGIDSYNFTFNFLTNTNNEVIFS